VLCREPGIKAHFCAANPRLTMDIFGWMFPPFTCGWGSLQALSSASPCASGIDQITLPARDLSQHSMEEQPSPQP